MPEEMQPTEDGSIRGIMKQTQGKFGPRSGGVPCDIIWHFKVSEEFDFFRVLLNKFGIDNVRAKTAKMPAKFDVAPAAMISDTPPLKCPAFAILNSINFFGNNVSKSGKGI